MSYPYGPPPQQQGWGPPPQQNGWGQPPAQPQWSQPPQQNGWGQPPAQPQWSQPPQQQETEDVGVPGSLADFYSQPSTGGGKALSFKDVGTAYFGIVNRQMLDTDIRKQTAPNSQAAQTFNDGRPKWQMVVPLNVQPAGECQDGKAQWYCKHNQRDQLLAALVAAEVPVTTIQTIHGPTEARLPEMGAGLYIRFSGTRNAGAGMNPAKVYDVQYFRPEQAKQLAQQYGIEYPTLPTAQPQAPQPGAGAGPQSAPAPGQAQATGQFPSAPPPQFTPAAQVGPPPSAADFAPPAPGQPGNPAQWQPQAPVPNGPQAPQQLPGVGGPPPPVDWGNGQQQAPQSHIPQASAPAGPPPGMTPENQALMAQMTGRAQQ